MTDLREATDRPMCECPKCGRAHWKLADSPPFQRPTIALHGVDLQEATTLINDAVFAAIEAAGFKVLGREPTQAMWNAGLDNVFPCATASAIWRAMFDAAPALPPASLEKKP
jgi:hypothetical protein